ncbi:MAG: hypothetical protein NE330_10750 [Lentisphaeraceae bacterium]|nr:hypothetical protein [Lentisphaeraceae bacterium]
MQFIVYVALIIHIGYLLTAKGYSRNIGIPIVSILAVLGYLYGIYYMDDTQIKSIPWVFGFMPILASWLIISFIIPPKKGALGKEYMIVKFACPFCQAELEFPRSLEGTARSCSSCEEIVTVTEDKSVHDETVTNRKELLELYDQFGNEESARDEINDEADVTPNPIFGSAITVAKDKD